MVINWVQEFDGTNREATIPWLDHIKAIAKNTGFNPSEVAMSKLKGTVLCDIKAVSKEGNLLYFWFCQLPLDHYLNVPYAPDALNAYAHLMQGGKPISYAVLGLGQSASRMHSSYF